MEQGDFNIDCSDEEVQKEFTKTVYGIEPSPSEIIRLYEALAKDGNLSIKWKWGLGRRLPTPSQSDSESEKEELAEKVDTSGFDFDDEPASVRFTPRRTPGSAGPKGSAKKKTTNFENILASVRRQKKLELREKSKSRRDRK
ncbi:PAXIP1-associated glutamate-rich protein 1-like [Homarus americanus]|uniref:PAXIP1-associated glutamate-rich protein 1-like n=2 Tax=Homarus americanus TaxID=6706 RepID=A0A8J5N3C0_HOMAM|nr:PAXIP1-associated glutamate-rich protein 1-like [Homarus americanus]